MLPEWQAHIDELLERYRQKRDQLREVRRAVGAARVTVTTEDEMITVTLGPHGRLVGLDLNPRVYRRMSPSELAAAVLAAADEASSRLDEQVRAALTPARPDAADAGRRDAKGTNGADAAGGVTGVNGANSANSQAAQAAEVAQARMLPERPDDLDAFRERYGLRGGPGDS